MIQLSFYPKMIMEVLTHIPTIAFKTIKINELLKASKLVLKNYSNTNLQTEILEKISLELPQGLIITNDLGKQNFDSKSGDHLIELYFHQLLSSSPTLLDLRQNYFSFNGKDTLWKPNFIIYQFNPDFKNSLINLYKGFYLNDDNLLDEALLKLHLTKGLNPKEKNILKELFFSHFGKDTENLKFSLEKFQTSFYNIFEFFLKNKIQVDTDFLFVGFYLITLYQHLENYSHSYNVKKIFIETLTKNNNL